MLTINNFNSRIAPQLNILAHNRSRIGFPGLIVNFAQNPIPRMNPEVFVFRGVAVSNLFTAVQFEENKIVFYEKMNNTIGISFLFSGCYLAQFEYNNKKYIAHISTGTGIDCKPQWDEFVSQCKNDNSFSNFFLYKPYDNYSAESIINAGQEVLDTCGIIDNLNDFQTGIIKVSDCSLVDLYVSHTIKRVFGPINDNNIHNILIGHTNSTH